MTLPLQTDVQCILFLHQILIRNSKLLIPSIPLADFEGDIAA
jgi:hypothetical protein